jgi:hypothetical protein
VKPPAICYILGLVFLEVELVSSFKSQISSNSMTQLYESFSPFLLFVFGKRVGWGGGGGVGLCWQLFI